MFACLLLVLQCISANLVLDPNASAFLLLIIDSSSSSCSIAVSKTRGCRSTLIICLAVVGAQANDVMDLIAIDSFRHSGGFLTPAKPLKKANARAKELCKTLKCARSDRFWKPVVIYG